jgi:hypothetical protein
VNIIVLMLCAVWEGRVLARQSPIASGRA